MTTDPCAQEPDQELLFAIEQFNAGEWFQCHETLEELWVGAKGELRPFYQGLLQLAVALHHWRNGNFRGAVILLEGGSGLLGQVPPVCLGVDAAALVARARQLLQALNELGEERMAKLPPELIPTIAQVASPSRPSR